MFLKKTRTLAMAALLMGVATYGCTDDEEKTEEPVKTDAAGADAAPPADAAGAGGAGAGGATAYTPQTVYFAFDDYTLNGDAQSRLQQLADHLKAAQTTVVQVEGHCDERGSIEYNLALGERRAQSVKTYLSQLGVEAGRLSIISYGEEKPAAEGHDESAWAKNRRAEFTLTNNK